MAALLNALSQSPTFTPTLPGASRLAISAARMSGCVARSILGRHIPFDRHFVDRRLGLVPAVGDDGDAAAEDPATDQHRIGDRELDRRDDARLAADLLEIVALHLAAIDGAGFDGRPFHAGQVNVDAVDGFAGDFRRDIEILLLGAHQRPFRRRLDADAFGIRVRRLSGERSDLAVGGGAPRRAVGDDAVGRTHLFDRHVPDLGRREQQPLARFRAGELKIVAAVLHRRGGVRAHAAIEGVRDAGEAGAVAGAELGLAAAVGIGRAVAHDVQRPGRRHFLGVTIGGGVLRPDLAPIALQFLGDHHGVGGPHALAELGLGDADGHGFVGRDDDPGVDFRRCGFDGPGGAFRIDDLRVEHAAASRSR